MLPYLKTILQNLHHFVNIYTQKKQKNMSLSKTLFIRIAIDKLFYIYYNTILINIIWNYK